jgi:hypothetical protein
MSIEILSPDPNTRGTLFTRLMGDLFYALGYDDLTLDLQRSGREVDISGTHSLEKTKHLRVECKATSDPIGGSDVNKFAGVVDVERRKIRKVEGESVALVGYYVSLSGFTGTALSQEADDGEHRLTLVDADQIIEQLMRSKIVVSSEKALHVAGRLLPTSAELMPGEPWLAIHALGSFWVVPFETSHQLTHFTLIHADGTPLAVDLARQVQADAEASGVLVSGLTYIGPKVQQNNEQNVANARLKFLRYTESMCGTIQLDGLPADEEVGGKTIRLESLFVPLHLSPARVDGEAAQLDLLAPDVIAPVARGARKTTQPGHRRKRPREAALKHVRTEVSDGREPIGKVLERSKRIAILAAPGGGKSTLLKRIAVAYSFPERLNASSDNLPSNDWVPFFIRCRDLGTFVNRPINQILSYIGNLAGMTDAERQAFAGFVDSELQSGRAIVLVDGLDEIASDVERAAFADSLRLFLRQFPGVGVIVTSREAGFRVVAGTLAVDCERFRLSDFDDDDISHLVLAWHREVYGVSKEADERSAELAQAIIENPRIKSLSGNPLLLTTLLLVNRWLGHLPTRRTALYGKAIEVLLMTWNVQAHAPIPLEEAIPRLAYIAFAMMRDGVQRISRSRLRSLLINARNDLPEVLGYSRLNDAEFIDRIELRSSLLVLSGHSVTDGTLEPLYEFRHLTFQEYLVAVAVAEGFYAGRSDEDTPVDLLKPYLFDEAWSEVISLAAVLLGRRSKGIVLGLVEGSRVELAGEDREREDMGLPYSIRLLTQCLLDEIQIAPSDLDEALRVLATSSLASGIPHSEPVLLLSIGESKYGERLLSIVNEIASVCGPNVNRTAEIQAVLVCQSRKYAAYSKPLTKTTVREISALISSKSESERCAAYILAMLSAYDGAIESEFRPPERSIVADRDSDEGKEAIERAEKRRKNALVLLAPIAEKIERAISAESDYGLFCVSWAIAWLARLGWVPSDHCQLLVELSRGWQSLAPSPIRRQASWATVTLGLPVLPCDHNTISDSVIDRVRAGARDNTSFGYVGNVQMASLVLAVALGRPFTGAQVLEILDTASCPESNPSLEADLRAFLKTRRRRQSANSDLRA